jgi:hypothetical protein
MNISAAYLALLVLLPFGGSILWPQGSYAGEMVATSSGRIDKEPLEALLIGKSFYGGPNSWVGRINGKNLEVNGCSPLTNPLQGMVFVMQEGDVRTSRYYPTPTATGPLRVLDEKNGILTLQSVSGTLTRYAGPTYEGRVVEQVKTPGGGIYHFNLKTRGFE